MATREIGIPPLPEGFELDPEVSKEIPPLPKGFELQKKSSKSSEIGRHALRTTSRVIETGAGALGDVLSIPKKLSPLPEKIKTAIYSTVLPNPLLPTSEEIRNISTKIFGKTVQPQSETESLLDDIVSDATSLAIPIKGKIPFLRAIGTSIVGNVGSEVAKQYGVGKTGQDATKLGTFFLAGLTGRGGLKKFWQKKYAEADAAVPKGASLSAQTLEKDLKGLESLLEKGIETPSKKAVLNPINELLSKIKKGHLPVDDAMQAKRDINQLRDSLFDTVKERGARTGAKMKLNDISSYLDKTLEDYGRSNPAFYKPYKEANEAFGGYYQSKRVGNFLKSHLPKVAKTHALTALLLEKIFFPAAVLPTLGGAAAGFGALKSGELAARLFKNPTLRKYYSSLIQSSLKENVPATIRNIRGIDKEIREHPEEWKELIPQS